MTWEELLHKIEFENIEVTIIKPVRKDDWAKKGKIIAFKSGLWQYPKTKHKNGSISMGGQWKMIKPPRIRVEYNAFEFGGRCYSDWIPTTNCEFNFKSKL